MHVSLQQVADELYGLPPDQFTAARNDLSGRLSRGGERDLAAAVRSLRRPAISAWLVNLLVRRRRKALNELLAIGEQLRTAMVAGAGSDVRHLSDDRRGAVAALVAELDDLAQRRVPPAVAEEVALTLEAATADTGAAAAVVSGRLIRPLRYAGFGELPDFAGVVGLAAVPGTAGKAGCPGEAGGCGARAENKVGARNKNKATSEHRQEVQAAERIAQETAGHADDAQRRYEYKLAEAASAKEGVRGAEMVLEQLKHRLTAAEERLEAALADARAAESAADEARQLARDAHRKADAARQRLASTRA